MKVIKTGQQERFCCRLIHTAVPFNIEQKWLRVSQRNCPPCIERGSDFCFREDPWFFYSTTACKFMLYFLTTGSPLRDRILCIYTIFIHGQSFLSTPTGHNYFFSQCNYHNDWLKMWMVILVLNNSDANPINAYI